MSFSFDSSCLPQAEKRQTFLVALKKFINFYIMVLTIEFDLTLIEFSIWILILAEKLETASFAIIVFPSDLDDLRRDSSFSISSSNASCWKDSVV